MNLRLRPNEPNVISEPMEGELVVINLETGCYYSLNESAATIWQQLAAGLTSAEIAKQVFDGTGYNPEDLFCKVDSFCQYLMDEQLMVASNEDSNKVAAPPLGLSFIKPIIEKFADMQDMLLLDPIHEVNDKGWPNEAK
ncbi:MAG: PqqD family protein [Eubacteriales bacterium]|nr:PqqD family protein [Eubacteriales bacterium]